MTFKQFYWQTYEERSLMSEYEYALLVWNTAMAQAIDLCAPAWEDELEENGLGTTETFRNVEE